MNTPSQTLMSEHSFHTPPSDLFNYKMPTTVGWWAMAGLRDYLIPLNDNLQGVTWEVILHLNYLQYFTDWIPSV